MIITPRGRLRQTAPILAVAAGLLLAGSTRCYSADDELLARFLQGLKHRRDAIHSARFVCEGTQTFIKGSMEGLPERDYTYPIKFTWTFDLDVFRVRYESSREIFYRETNSFSPHVSTSVFDGTIRRAVEPRSANSTPKNPLPDGSPEFRDNCGVSLYYPEQLPLLFSLGIVRPVMTFPGEHKYNVSIPDSAYAIFGQGKPDVHAQCIVRTAANAHGMFDEFHVDLAKDGAIVLWKQYHRGGVGRSAEIKYQDISGIWMPRQYVYRSGNKPDAVDMINSITVKQCEVNLPLSDEMFTLEPSVGMTLVDEATHKFYRVGAGGKREAIE